MIQRKKFAEWSRDEFPTLLSIENNLESLEKKNQFTEPVIVPDGPTQIFPKCQSIQTNKEELNDITDEEDAVRNNEISDMTETHVNKATTETFQMSEHVEPLYLTPSRR